jgi:CheY-like chemotaxis protein
MAIRLAATWGDAHPGAQPGHFQAIEISGGGEMPGNAGASRATGPDAARARDLAGLCTEHVVGPFTEDGVLRMTLLLASSCRPPRAAGSTPGRPAGSPPAGSSATVLLVEDQPAVLRATAEGLRRRGWEVLAADGPEQAIDRLRASNVDILVTDIAMPGGVSGVDLARHARRLRPDLPVLLVSGFAGSALGEHGLKPGEFELMNKPFRPSALAERLLGMLRTGR